MLVYQAHCNTCQSWYDTYQLHSNPRLMFKAHFIGRLNKPRRRRQRERHQAKGLMSKTIAVHVRFKSLYISVPSSAK